jgi:hypothetical protein
MAKVTIKETSDTPTQAIVKAANEVHTVEAQGRTFGVRKLQALDRLKMFEVVGAENSKNEAYLGYAALAFHVVSIDGETVNRPTSKLQLEALIQRLGDDGMDAVGAALEKLFLAQPDGGTEPIKN